MKYESRSTDAQGREVRSISRSSNPFGMGMLVGCLITLAVVAAFFFASR